MQHGRVEATCQRHRRDRHAGLLAGSYRLSLEMFAMGSSSTTTGIDQLSRSIHVNAYLLS